jgi:hypothetical protein
MRIWSFHPCYLDAKGLVALWREALLAQAVLRGRTRGYTRHPQLARFRDSSSPVSAIATYLRTVAEEANARGYCFAVERIARTRPVEQLRVTTGQIDFEWRHFLRKAEVRAPQRFEELHAIERPESHPLFRVVRGPIAPWEKGDPTQSSAGAS